ncbi:MAG: NfeD family protein [Bacillota bacterium]
MGIIENLSLFTAFLYVIGLVLLLVEAVVPGFGIAGAGGIICVIISIVLLSNSIYEATLMILGTAAVLVLLAILLYKVGIGKRAIGKLILNTEQKNEEGYSSNLDYSRFLGKKGVAVTPLRSSGMVLVENERLDAVSEGEFIEKDAGVEVIRIEGRRIIVREINK